MQSAVKVILFIFVGALLVLVITHAAGFSTAVTAVGGQVDNTASLLTGSTVTTSGVKVGAANTPAKAA